MLFSILINDFFNVIKHYKYKLFVDDIKFLRTVNSVDDCILLQSDVKRTQGWCTAKVMKCKSTVLLLSLGKQMFFIILVSYGTLL